MLVGWASTEEVREHVGSDETATRLLGGELHLSSRDCLFADMLCLQILSRLYQFTGISVLNPVTPVS